MRHTFKFYIDQRVMVYCQTGNVDEDNKWSGDWVFLPAVVLRRWLKEPHRKRDEYEGDVAEIYDVMVFDEKLTKRSQVCDFYEDRLYRMDEELVPRNNLIEETF